MNVLSSLLALLAVSGFCNPVLADNQPMWGGSWGSSPAGLPTEAKMGSYEYPSPTVFRGTIRYRLRISLGGSQVRLRISNEYGDRPLELAAVSIGIGGEGFDAVPGSLKRATFGGKDFIVIPPGAPGLTDPIDLRANSLSDLVVSVYVPNGLSTYSCTPDYTPANQTVVVGPDATLQEKLSAGKCLSALRPVVSAVDVLVDQSPRVVVALGDSITDGSTDPETRDRGWPGALARRLHGKAVSVVNAGISGNRLLRDFSIAGVSALARLDRDVFSVTGLSHVILLEGVNDLGMSGGMMGDNAALVTSQELITAYSQIVARAHERRINIFCGTVLPFEGTEYAGYYSEDKEKVRQALNAWIRTSKTCDAVIDFDAAMRDSDNPRKLKAAYDSGDHLHPNHAGARRMAEVIDLHLFD